MDGSDDVGILRDNVEARLSGNMSVSSDLRPSGPAITPMTPRR